MAYFIPPKAERWGIAFDDSPVGFVRAFFKGYNPIAVGDEVATPELLRRYNLRSYDSYVKTRRKDYVEAVKTVTEKAAKYQKEQDLFRSNDIFSLSLWAREAPPDLAAAVPEKQIYGANDATVALLQAIKGLNNFGVLVGGEKNGSAPLAINFALVNQPPEIVLELLDVLARSAVPAAWFKYPSASGSGEDGYVVQAASLVLPWKPGAYGKVIDQALDDLERLLPDRQYAAKETSAAIHKKLLEVRSRFSSTRAQAAAEAVEAKMAAMTGAMPSPSSTFDTIPTPEGPLQTAKKKPSLTLEDYAGKPWVRVGLSALAFVLFRDFMQGRPKAQ